MTTFGKIVENNQAATFFLQSHRFQHIRRHGNFIAHILVGKTKDIQAI